ncbi:hypothetical protein SM033_00111 [Vibrio phage vB_VpaM_sm033]|nr:hypothetical protein SM033_00111 [Vibrio phage vB_VpaM_sm033]
MSSNVYVKYTGRVVENGQAVPVWKTRPSVKEDVKTGAKIPVPGVPLIAMNGPYDRETAQNFLDMRERESNGLSVWEIVEEADLAKHTDVTESNIRK